MAVDSLGVVEKTAGAGKVVYKIWVEIYPYAKTAFAIMSRIKPHIIY